MFVTIGNIAQHMSDFAGEVLVASGAGRIATPAEAAECVSRLAMNGSGAMHDANTDFKIIYSSVRPTNPATLLSTGKADL